MIPALLWFIHAYNLFAWNLYQRAAYVPVAAVEIFKNLHSLSGGVSEHTFTAVIAHSCQDRAYFDL